MRENPDRSLHWCILQRVEMMRTGTWWDTRCSSCTLQGTRRKRQRLRHNIEEFNQWQPVGCHHWHDPNEWEPQEVAGKVYWPSQEQAEYTAALAFHVAVSCSWWALRAGLAVLHIPRLPQVSADGGKRPWPQAFRQWAMVPMSIALGLPVKGLPQGTSPEKLGLKTMNGQLATLPDECISIGQGRHSQRLPRTKWASPFIPGQHGSDPGMYFI